MPQLTLNHVDLRRLDRIAQHMVRSFPTELVIGLVGTLGAGKTTFTQALAAAMGVQRDDVTSPTFTLLTSYDARIDAGPIQLHHLDAYRLADEDEFLELGVEEFFEQRNTWTLIEWADRVKGVLPSGILWVTIELEANNAEASNAEASNAEASNAEAETPARQLNFETERVDLANAIRDLASMIDP